MLEGILHPLYPTPCLDIAEVDPAYSASLVTLDRRQRPAICPGEIAVWPTPKIKRARLALPPLNRAKT
jgi:hypothetical protein